jgi:hypothetical protein
LHNSENESAGSSIEAGGQDSSVGEGDGPSEPIMINEIELVFKPHPTEMGGDNSLIKALKENSVRYIKTTANASGKDFIKMTVWYMYYLLLWILSSISNDLSERRVRPEGKKITVPSISHVLSPWIARISCLSGMICVVKE